MPTRRNPRHGTKQFWPRRRSKRAYPNVNSWAQCSEVIPLGFPGYKAGMTHIIFDDKRNNALTKGEKVMWPVTVIECPPITIHAARFYLHTVYGKKVVTDVLNTKPKKELERKLVPIKSDSNFNSLPDYDDITILVHTNPSMTGIGKKKPDVFELGLGGTVEQKLHYVKSNLGKDLNVSEVLKEGMLTDMHAISIGKGYCGVVKKYGVAMRSHKSEKARRAVIQGSQGNAHVLYMIPKSGKIGYHQRTHFNQLVVKVDSNPKNINPAGGFVNYGEVKSPYILIKGSVIGPKKRLAIFARATRPTDKQTMNGVNITFTSLASQQGT
jgi:large subunit ribosomal protein L3